MLPAVPVWRALLDNLTIVCALASMSRSSGCPPVVPRHRPWFTIELLAISMATFPDLVDLAPVLGTGAVSISAHVGQDLEHFLPAHGFFRGRIFVFVPVVSSHSAGVESTHFTGSHGM